MAATVTTLHPDMPLVVRAAIERYNRAAFALKFVPEGTKAEFVEADRYVWLAREYAKGEGLNA